MKRLKDPTALAGEIRQYFLENGLKTSAAIARATGHGQPQVYRNLFGKPRTVSRTLRELCKHASISEYEGVLDPRESGVLMDALAEIWDGSESHARRLAKLLFAHRQAHM